MSKKLVLIVATVGLVLAVVYFTLHLSSPGLFGEGQASKSNGGAATQVSGNNAGAHNREPHLAPNRANANALATSSVNSEGKVSAVVPLKPMTNDLFAKSAKELLDLGSLTALSMAVRKKQNCMVTDPAHALTVLENFPTGIGKGTLEERRLAALRLGKMCEEFFAQASRATVIDREGEIFRARGLSIKNPVDADNPQVAKALHEIMTTPLLGNIGFMLLYAEQSELNSAIADEKTLHRALATDLLICRLGDDCGPDSLIANRLCMFMGFCGGGVEEAIMNGYAHKNFNWNVLDQYVTKMQVAFGKGDTSIFKKSAPKS